jgi:hypothetical protein
MEKPKTKQTKVYLDGELSDRMLFKFYDIEDWETFNYGDLIENFDHEIVAKFKSFNRANDDHDYDVVRLSSIAEDIQNKSDVELAVDNLIEKLELAQRREQHAIDGLRRVISKTKPDDWVNQIATQFIYELDNHSETYDL